MSDVTIYHNPRCSKSRQTLALLEERGIQPNIVLYLENTPNQKQLKSLLSKLGISTRDLMRTGESEHKDNNLKDKDLSEAALITAMVKYPKLIERPIVVANGKAALGRPPEKVLEIL